MLSQEERERIAALVRAAEHPQAVSVEALRVIQRSRSFVPDEAIRDLAPLLSLSADELEGVATFYPFIFRRPVGRNIILVCDSVACWIMGYESILEHLRVRLGIGFGGTTKDQRFTLLPVSCIGACDQAPAIMGNGRLYGHLDGPKIDELLEDCL